MHSPLFVCHSPLFVSTILNHAIKKNILKRTDHNNKYKLVHALYGGYYYRFHHTPSPRLLIYYLDVVTIMGLCYQPFAISGLITILKYLYTSPLPFPD